MMKKAKGCSADITIYREARKVLPVKGYRPDICIPNIMDYRGAIFLESIREFDSVQRIRLNFSSSEYDVDYSALKPGASFDIMEGPNYIGHGVVSTIFYEEFFQFIYENRVQHELVKTVLIEDRHERCICPDCYIFVGESFMQGKKCYSCGLIFCEECIIVSFCSSCNSGRDLGC